MPSVAWSHHPVYSGWAAVMADLRDRAIFAAVSRWSEPNGQQDYMTHTGPCTDHPLITLGRCGLDRGQTMQGPSHWTMYDYISQFSGEILLPFLTRVFKLYNEILIL